MKVNYSVVDFCFVKLIKLVDTSFIIRKHINTESDKKLSNLIDLKLTLSVRLIQEGK